MSKVLLYLDLRNAGDRPFTFFTENSSNNPKISLSFFRDICKRGVSPVITIIQDRKPLVRSLLCYWQANARYPFGITGTFQQNRLPVSPTISRKSDGIHGFSLIVKTRRLCLLILQVFINFVVPTIYLRFNWKPIRQILVLPRMAFYF